MSRFAASSYLEDRPVRSANPLMLFLTLLIGLTVLTALTFLNVEQTEVGAVLPPVSKNLNLSVYPLASACWAPSDYGRTAVRGVQKQLLRVCNVTALG